MIKHIYELYHPQETSDIIEIFDCYDTRYGNIFYKGQLIENFYKKSYYEVLENYKIVKQLKKLGLDANNAKLFIYRLEPLRDYDSSMSVISFEDAIEYDYDELLDGFVKDFANIETAVKTIKKNSPYETFLTIKTFTI